MRKSFNKYLKSKVFEKFNGVCFDCGEKAPPWAGWSRYTTPFHVNRKTFYLAGFQIHHLVPVTHGGENDINNLVLLCSNCHSKRHHPFNKKAEVSHA